MKSYQIKYNLNQRSPATIYVSKFSSFKVAIDATANGERVSTITLAYDGALIPSSGTYHDYVQFDLTADENPSRKTYDVTADGTSLKLFIVTTDSDVAELPAGGYTLPVATDSTLGGIKVGEGLSVDSTGKLDVTGGSTEETDPVFTDWLSASPSRNVVIGYQADGGNYNDGRSVAIGSQATANINGSISIGLRAGRSGTGQESVCIGYQTQGAFAAIAIGNNARATASEAVQLGQGTNSTAYTLQYKNYQLVDADGNIPQARAGNILSTVTEADWQTLSATATAGKIYFVTES